MRKIEQAIINTISGNSTGNFGNTLIFRHCDGHSLKVYLHSNHIATLFYSPEFGKYGRVEFTLAGWPSRITRSRLNVVFRGAFGRHLLMTYQKKGEQMLSAVSGAFENHVKLDSTAWYSYDGAILQKLAK